MEAEQLLYEPGAGWSKRQGNLAARKPQMVLVFGGRHLLEAGEGLDHIRQTYPGAHLVVASTSGEITNTEVTEDRITATAVFFEKTTVSCAATSVRHVDESYAAGRELAGKLSRPGLVHVFVVSDGALVNGTELARGFNEHLANGVLLTGGLAGDGNRFEKTLVGLDEQPVKGRIVAVGFYGDALRVSFGSAGGWESFGPEREVTKAHANTLFELDGKSALALYKTYLGAEAARLPGSALRFPLCVNAPGSAQTVVRTILSIDEPAQSMTFAGDIPVGSRVRFMRASYEELIDGAAAAAEQLPNQAASLVVCVSCVGRRIVLGQRTEEETESVRAVLGPDAILTGFYSYGELAPAGRNVACQLHNQTMTITSFRED
ncbi:MAG TPA: FIST N-terminal domain-containing protein [Lacunisphaera sp.]